MRFIDEVRFVVASGHGGPGAVSFRRERYVPRGGPDGGDGGRGGSIVFEATRSRNTLVDFRANKVYRAANGQSGGKNQRTGRGGEDLKLLVPVGTVLFDHETGERLADLSEHEQSFAIEGGMGGKGNLHFASSTHRTPRVAQPGLPGRELTLRLELRLLADVGLLGFPNAGKSTLISRISAARPKVADYPFTTLVPQLGVVQRGEGRSFVVADIPGLIEGASEGAGLGHQFLRHLQRCRLLVHLVPADRDDDPLNTKAILDRELAQYDDQLARTEQIVVLSKIDILSPEEAVGRLQSFADAGLEAIGISSVTGQGIDPLLNRLEQRLSSPNVPKP